MSEAAAEVRSAFSFCSAALLCLFTPLAGVHAGVVEDWNVAFLQAVRRETPPPCLVSRNLPILHLCIHRAVQDAIKAGLSDDDMALAANAAADKAFRLIFPSEGRFADEVRAKSKPRGVVARVSATHNGGATSQSIAEAAVVRTFKERENDGSATTVHYVPGNKPGQWQRTPPNFRPPELPHWGQMRPFVLDDVTKFRAPPPPALDSKIYAEDMNEVKKIGGMNSATRTAEQTLIAKFWADFSYTTSPAGHWNDIARQVSLQRKLKLAESARLFALLNVTLADTCIAIWNTKYHHNFWRPVTAIHRADEDNNAATSPDKAWEPLLVTPPHPEYVSGHSGISGAAAVILERTFGTEDIHFDAESDDVRDTRRSFTSFSACADEIARSRVYGGIHYPSAGKEGLRLGRNVAASVSNAFE